jgi:lincosamide nucleotidyltransferase A/C/D/E
MMDGGPAGRWVMSPASVVALLGATAAEGVPVCVGGGWGIDALLGEQTREHGDLDLWAPAAGLEGLLTALGRSGIDRILVWGDDRPWNFVLHDGGTLRVDLHLYEPLDGTTLHYGSVTKPVTFPAGALAGHGVIAGTDVVCEAPEWSLRWHLGYPPRDVDRHDVPLICERFGLPLPDTFG